MIVFVFFFVYTVEGVCKSATKGLQKGLTILLFHLSLGLLGNVEHCSLVNATNITVDCRKYCAILKKGLYQGNETFEECKAMNAFFESKNDLSSKTSFSKTEQKPIINQLKSGGQLVAFGFLLFLIFLI